MIKNDGWLNLYTGMGFKNKDKIRATKFGAGELLGYQQLEDLYRYNGLAKRIIDLPSNEMVREWLTIKGDENDFINQAFEELDVKNKVSELLKWSRLFGGALMVLIVDDGQELDQPLNIENVRKLEAVHVFDRYQVDWVSTDLYLDPTSKKFGYPQFYKVTPVYNATPFRIHESRTLRLDGEPLPSRAFYRSHNWGDSVLFSVYTELKHLGTAFHSTANIMEDFIQTILTIDNLGNLLAGGQEDLVRKRLDIIDMGRHVSNTILLDKEEQFEKKASSVGGIDGIIDRFQMQLSSVTGIPFTFLFGKSPAGLNATGDSDVRIFYDFIKSEQEDRLRPLIEVLIKIIMKSKNGPFNGNELEDWSFEFNPLWQMSEMETADLRHKIAQTDSIYLDRGVVSSEEIAISRFGGSEYSIETNLSNNENQLPAFTPEDEQMVVDSLEKKDDNKMTEYESEMLKIINKIVE